MALTTRAAPQLRQQTDLIATVPLDAQRHFFEIGIKLPSRDPESCRDWCGALVSLPGDFGPGSPAAVKRKSPGAPVAGLF